MSARGLVFETSLTLLEDPGSLPPLAIQIVLALPGEYFIQILKNGL